MFRCTAADSEAMETDSSPLNAKHAFAETHRQVGIERERRAALLCSAVICSAVLAQRRYGFHPRPRERRARPPAKFRAGAKKITLTQRWTLFVTAFFAYEVMRFNLLVDGFLQYQRVK